MVPAPDPFPEEASMDDKRTPGSEPIVPDEQTAELDAVERFFVDLGLPRQWWLSLPIIIAVLGGIWLLVNWLMPLMFPSVFGG